jgi:hypothetical protein
MIRLVLEIEQVEADFPRLHALASFLEEKVDAASMQGLGVRVVAWQTTDEFGRLVTRSEPYRLIQVDAEGDVTVTQPQFRIIEEEVTGVLEGKVVGDDTEVIEAVTGD